MHTIMLHHLQQKKNAPPKTLKLQEHHAAHLHAVLQKASYCISISESKPCRRATPTPSWSFKKKRKQQGKSVYTHAVKYFIVDRRSYHIIRCINCWGAVEHPPHPLTSLGQLQPIKHPLVSCLCFHNIHRNMDSVPGACTYFTFEMASKEDRISSACVQPASNAPQPRPRPQPDPPLPPPCGRRAPVLTIAHRRRVSRCYPQR